MCRAGVCLDYAQVRLNVTADTEGASSEPGVFVYDLASGASCQAGTCGGFAYGTPVKLRASPIGGHRFIGWSGQCSGSELDVVIERLTDDLYCVANYLRRTRVTGNIAGAPAGRASGVIASSDSVSAVCEDAACEVDLGAQVRLSAPTRWGERFARWTGAGCGEANTRETLVTAQDSDLVCSATYIGRYTVSGRATVGKAMVKVSSAARSAVCEPGSCVIDGGDAALLEAPEVDGYRFAGWSGTSACVGGNPALRIDPVVGPQRCLATYTPRVRVRGKSNGAMPSPVVTALSFDALAACDIGGGSGFCDIDVGGSALLIAQSSPGFRLTGWSGPACDGETGSGLALENVIDSVECTAEYRRGIAISGVVVGAEGQVRVTSTTPGAQCAADRCILDEGGEATLEAPTVAGSRFLGWSGDALCTGQDPTLRIPRVMTSVTCIAGYAPRYEVSGQTAPDDGGSVLASSPTVGASCEGDVCLVPEGGEVTLEARASGGFRFAGWSGGGACTSASATLRIAGVRGNHRCQANFVATISVMGAVRPEGSGTVLLSSDRGASSCNGAVCSVDRGALVGATAVPFEGYDFAGWSDCSSARDAIIELPEIMRDTVCTANFAPRRYTVTSSVTPPASGAVAATSFSEGASCTGGSCSVSFGGAVRLVATESAGFAFTGWSGCSTSNGLVLTLDPVRTNQTCIANFTRVALTATVISGAGGSVEVVAAADGATCGGSSCTFPFGGGSITLRATPAAGYVFGAWSDCSSSTDATLVLAQLTQNVNCQANFTAQRASVTGVMGPSSPPNSGTLVARSTGPGASCSGAGCTVDFGATVELTAMPATGFRFAGWTGCTTSGMASIALPNVSSNLTCTATFERDRFAVRGRAMPAMGGTIAATSTAPGAACSGSECALNQGDSVTLTALPAASFGFMGWSGTGCPSTSNPSNTFTVGGEVDCIATFAMLPPVTVGLVAGAGGSIGVSMPGGCAAPSCAVPHGGRLEAMATPGPGYEFASWTGAGCSSSGALLTVPSVTTPLACTATFARRFTIAATVAAGQSALGMVEVGTQAGACVGNACMVREGTLVYVTPRPANGATFAGWVEPVCTARFGNTAASFPATEDLSCTATFTGMAPGPGADAGIPPVGPSLLPAAATPAAPSPGPPASTGAPRPTPAAVLGLFPASARPLDLPLLNVPAQDAGLPF
ncbi:MAG: hypothetical protein ABW252_05670 [Polyangiales bacterium]